MCVFRYCVGAVQFVTGLLLCVGYCNVLVRYCWLQGYFCVCGTVNCWCTTFE